MNKFIHVVLAVLVLTLLLSGCARMSEEEKSRIKCPACGYEFELPAEG